MIGNGQPKSRIVFLTCIQSTTGEQRISGFFHARNKDLGYNNIYDLMTRAGVKFSNQRLCQPFGDDQKKGLWLYQLLEPLTWYKLLNRVSGVNSGALYSQDTGNINGNNKISKPDHFMA